MTRNSRDLNSDADSERLQISEPAEVEAGSIAGVDKSTFDRRVLRSLRRIVRAIDLYSRELKASCGLTAPQLVCLSAISREGKTTAVSLAVQVHLSPSTLVGIIDRLEKSGLVQRARSGEDRRQVVIMATEAGKDAVRKAPPPLQQNLLSGFGKMPPDERATIAQSLETIVALMEAQEIRVAPLLTSERKSYAATRSMKKGAAASDKS